MKLLLVLFFIAASVGCGGYGSSYNSMTGGTPPHISSLNPTSATAGTAVSLTITGTGFASGSVVYWSTTPIAAGNTGYTSTTQLTASISAAQTANPGTVSIYVHTAAGNSNSVNFTVM